jgi:5,6-dimethylbenzimidazole synthase
LRAALGIPASIQPIAYLCVGYVTHFLQKPELETSGWLPRTPLSDAVWIDRWQQRDAMDPLLGNL